MGKFYESHEELDFFVIPVTSGTKEQTETIAMITTLSEFGIPENKIRLIFNRVESDVEDEFQILLNFLKKNYTTIKTNAAIFENELFDDLAIKKCPSENY